MRNRLKKLPNGTKSSIDSTPAPIVKPAFTRSSLPELNISTDRSKSGSKLHESLDSFDTISNQSKLISIQNPVPVVKKVKRENGKYGQNLKQNQR